MKKSKVDISIVIPVCNEEPALDRCLKEVDAECKKLNRPYEIIFVDDGSKDKSLSILESFAKEYNYVKVITFSRNFGQNPALFAGFKYASGDAVINLDADLQDPAHLIGEYVAKWEEGYDVVLSKRKKRKGESFFKKFTSKLFYKVYNFLSKTNVPKDCGISRLLSRKVLNEILALREKNLYLAGLTDFVGYKYAVIEFDRDPRISGVTKYSVKRLIKLAITNILPFSTTPINFVTGTGVFLGVGGGAMLITLIVLSILSVCFSPILWIISTMLILSGIITVGIGIVGTYVAVTYKETLDRPRYIIANKYNLGDDDE